MKKDIKKHKFTHPDPENIETTKETNKKSVNTSKGQTSPLPRNIAIDLKKSVITISVFIVVLIIFYLLDKNYDLLGQIKNII